MAPTPPPARDAQGRVVGGVLNPTGRPKGRHPGGRPPKLTPELQARLVDTLKAGNYLEVAARFVGLDKTTVYAWLDKAREGDPRYVQFSNAIQAAQAHAEIRAVALLSRAAQDNWQAACAFLERRCGERWAKREQLRVNAETTPLQPLIVHVVADDTHPVGRTISNLGEDVPGVHFHPRAVPDELVADPPAPDPVPVVTGSPVKRRAPGV